MSNSKRKYFARDEDEETFMTNERTWIMTKCLQVDQEQLGKLDDESIKIASGWTFAREISSLFDMSLHAKLTLSCQCSDAHVSCTKVKWWWEAKTKAKKGREREDTADINFIVHVCVCVLLFHESHWCSGNSCSSLVSANCVTHLWPDVTKYTIIARDE